MALVLSRTWLYLILLFWFQFLLCLLTCYTCYQHWFENPAPVSLTVVCYRVDQSAAVWGDVDEFVSSVEPRHRGCLGTHSSGGQYGELSREVFSITGAHNCSQELPNTSKTMLVFAWSAEQAFMLDLLTYKCMAISCMHTCIYQNELLVLQSKGVPYQPIY